MKSLERMGLSIFHCQADILMEEGVVYQELKESFFTLENGEEKDYVT